MSVVVPQSNSEVGLNFGFESRGNHYVRELRGRVQLGVQGNTSRSHEATVVLSDLLLIVATCDSLSVILDDSETDRHCGAIITCLETSRQQNEDLHGTVTLDVQSKLRVIGEAVMIDATTGSLVFNAPRRVVVQFSVVLVEVLAE